MHKALIPLILLGTVDKVEDNIISVEIPNVQLINIPYTLDNNELLTDSTIYFFPNQLIPCIVEEGATLYFRVEPNSLQIKCELDPIYMNPMKRYIYL